MKNKLITVLGYYVPIKYSIWIDSIYKIESYERTGSKIYVNLPDGIKSIKVNESIEELTKLINNSI